MSKDGQKGHVWISNRVCNCSPGDGWLHAKTCPKHIGWEATPDNAGRSPIDVDVIEDAITLLSSAPAHNWSAGEPDETIDALRNLRVRLSESTGSEEGR